MKPVTVAAFDQWLAAYSQASVENVAEFDDQGLCYCFCEWWSSRQDDTFARQSDDAHR